MSDKKRKSNAAAAAAAAVEEESESASKDAELPSNEELARLLAKKESLENSLSSLERQIYALETSYLEDTYTVGNLLKGWEGYLSSRNASGSSSHKKRFKEEDRLFSLSSATGVKNPADESSRTSERGGGSTNKQKKIRDRNLKKGPGRPRKKGGKGGPDDEDDDEL